MSLLSEVWGELFDSSQFGTIIRPDALTNNYEIDHNNYFNRNHMQNRNDLNFLMNEGPPNHPNPVLAGDAGNVVPADDTRGLMMDVLENLPQNKLLIVEVGNELQCAICHEHAKLQDNLRLLPCKHRFHQTCVDVWLLQKHTCPLCRVNILDTLFTESIPDRAETLPGSETEADRLPAETEHTATTTDFDEPNMTEILRNVKRSTSPSTVRPRLDTKSLKF